MTKSKAKGMEFEATFKGMSSNHEKGKASISLNVARPAGVSLDAIDQLFTGAQRSIVAEIVPKGSTPDVSGQTTLLEPEVFEAVCESSGFTTRPVHLQCNFKFKESAINIVDLNKLGGRTGTLTVVRIGNARPEQGDGSDGGEEADAA